MKIGAYSLAAAALGPSLILNAPRTALATAPSYVETGAFQDPKYSWAMAFESVEIEDAGAGVPLFIHSQIGTQDGNTYSNVLSHIYYDYEELQALEHNAVRFKNATYPDGTKVDMVATIRDYYRDFRSNYTYPEHPYNYFIAALSEDNLAGSNPQLDASTKDGAPVFEWCGFKYIDFELKFVEAGTDTPFPVTGHFSFSDVDYGESFQIDGVTELLVAEGNDHLSLEGDLITSDLRGNEEVGLLNCTVTAILDNVSTFRLKAYQNPWKSGLYCLDSTTLINFTPDSPEKTVSIQG